MAALSDLPKRPPFAPNRQPPHASESVVTRAVMAACYRGGMQPGLAETLGPRHPEPKTVRTLWRMQGPSRIIAARIERHPFGRELVIAFEGVAEDVIETRFERSQLSILEQRADELRELLVAKGWSALRGSDPVRSAVVPPVQGSASRNC